MQYNLDHLVKQRKKKLLTQTISDRNIKEVYSYETTYVSSIKYML